MVMVLVLTAIGTGDERIETLDLVDQTDIHKKVERAVDRHWCRVRPLGLQPIEQRVSTHGSFGGDDEGQNRTPNVRQLAAFCSSPILPLPPLARLCSSGRP